MESILLLASSKIPMFFLQPSMSPVKKGSCERSTLNSFPMTKRIHVALTWFGPRVAWEIYGRELVRGWSVVPCSPFRAATDRCDRNVPSNGTMCYDDVPAAPLLIDWDASRIVRRFSYLWDKNRFVRLAIERRIITIDEKFDNRFEKVLD